MHRSLVSSDAAWSVQGIIPTLRLTPEVGMGTGSWLERVPKRRTTRCAEAWRRFGIIRIGTQVFHITPIDFTHTNIYRSHHY